MSYSVCKCDDCVYHCNVSLARFIDKIACVCIHYHRVCDLQNEERSDAIITEQARAMAATVAECDAKLARVRAELDACRAVCNV